MRDKAFRERLHAYLAGACKGQDSPSMQVGGVDDQDPTARPEENKLFSNFKYTRLHGFDSHGLDGTVSRRDPSQVICAHKYARKPPVER